MRLNRLRLQGMGHFKDELVLDLASIHQPIVALCGDNGAGKSTLLELYAGLLDRDTPTRGKLSELAQSGVAFVEGDVVSQDGRSYRIRQSIDAASGRSESLVLDEAGRAVLPSTSVREYDAWRQKKLTPKEVFFNTVFAPQASEGFFDLKEGDQKAVLLRALGIEIYEVLAEKARKRAAASKALISTLTARLADEVARGGDVDQARVALHRQEHGSASCASEVERLREALSRIVSERAAAQHACQDVDRQLAKRPALTAKLDQLAARVADAEARIRNGTIILNQADAIRLAADTVLETSASISLHTADRAAAQERVAAGDRALFAATTALRRAKSSLEDAERVLASLCIQIASAAHIREAAGLLPEAERTKSRFAEELDQAERDLEHLRDALSTSAADRIQSLRSALEEVADWREGSHAYDEDMGHPPRNFDEDTVSSIEAFARDRLVVDDERATFANAGPAKLEAARAAIAAMRSSLAEASARHMSLQDLAGKTDWLDSVEARFAQMTRDKDEHRATMAHRSQECEALGHAKAADLALVANLDASIRSLIDRKDQASHLAKHAGKLEGAEARMAELRDLVATYTSEATSLRAELAALDALQRPSLPDDRPTRNDLAEAEVTHRGSVERVALAQDALDRAIASSAKVAELTSERLAAEEDLADWTRLADDLGRSGLQAMEIDAAGPCLTSLVNDLLHTCVSRRWTVAVETSRPSSDGKKMIETCSVRVLDTERGRDAPAKSLSGGERVIVSEAFSLGLTMLSCERFGVRGATLIRDETGAALDESMGPAYIAMLRRAAEVVEASHIVFVSHNPALPPLADVRIVVRNGALEVMP